MTSHRCYFHSPTRARSTPGSTLVATLPQVISTHPHARGAPLFRQRWRNRFWCYHSPTRARSTRPHIVPKLARCPLTHTREEHLFRQYCRNRFRFPTHTHPHARGALVIASIEIGRQAHSPTRARSTLRTATAAVVLRSLTHTREEHPHPRRHPDFPRISIHTPLPLFLGYVQHTRIKITRKLL